MLRAAAAISGAVLLLAAAPSAQTAEDTASRPDVVLIVADDLGFSDLGCFGGEIATPVLDGLAEGGLRLAQFYGAGRGIPTRASLLTGVYAHQAGIGHLLADRGRRGYRGALTSRAVTMADVLRGAGYGTALSGKWHLTRRVQPAAPKGDWPLQRGFDKFFGSLVPGGSYFEPPTLTAQNAPTPVPDIEGVPWYYTDAISDRAALFVREHHNTNPDDPLFLHVAYTAPHWPLHAPEKVIQSYQERYKAGWDEMRAARLQRLQKLGIVPETTVLAPRPKSVAAWDSVSRRKHARLIRAMATYAAQVEIMDRGIGRILQSLRATGRLENTLLLFMSDNGASSEGGVFGFDRKKNTKIGTPQSFSSYGAGWATASNTPLRSFKNAVHEGGIASPCILHWGKGIAAAGALRHTPTHVVDVMATVLDVAGVAWPETWGGRDTMPLEGTSLRPLFAGDGLERTAPLAWEFAGSRALRRGKHKLVAKGEKGDWELYDIEADRGEANDLAEKETDLVEELAAQWQAWAERCHVLPLNPKPPKSRLQHEFNLRTGDSLAIERAPRIARRAFTVRALLTRGGTGVIVAQGDTQNGYSMFVTADGRLIFATRVQATASQVKCETPLPAGQLDIVARQNTDGTLTLDVNGRRVGSSRATSGLIQVHPTEGLEVGKDDGQPVGPYQPPAPFNGAIGAISITLGR